MKGLNKGNITVNVSILYLGFKFSRNKCHLTTFFIQYFLLAESS